MHILHLVDQLQRVRLQGLAQLLTAQRPVVEQAEDLARGELSVGKHGRDCGQERGRMQVKQSWL